MGAIVNRARTLPRLAGLLSGPLFAASLPGVDLPYLALVCLVPLLLAIRGLGVVARFFLGLGAGVLALLFTGLGIARLLELMGQATPATAWGLLFAYALYHALPWALFALVAEPLRRRAPRLLWVALPTWVVGVDLAFPAIFPLSFGHPVVALNPLAQVADVVGVHGITWLVVSLQVVLADAISSAHAERRAPWSRLAGAAGGLAVVLTYGALRLATLAGASGAPALRYAIVQPAYGPDELRSNDGRVLRAMRKRLLALLRQAAASAPNLVILPESAYPHLLVAGAGADLDPPGDRLSFELASLARQLRAHVVAGATRVAAPDQPSFNSLVQFGPDGRLASIYDKLRLVPFGERSILGALGELFPGFEETTAGKERAVFRVGPHRVAPTICYEAVFPGDVRSALSAGAGVLLNATNDAWFGETNAAEIHLLLQRGRAIENRIPLLRAAQSGISAVVLPDGTVAARGPLGDPAVLHGAVVPSETHSLYTHVGEWWLLLPTLVTLVTLGRSARRRRAAVE